jgi:hypothetical protein
MNSDLIVAFKNARYLVMDPKFTLKIGEINSDLDRLLLVNTAKTWAFITPFNPGSEIIADIENEARLEELKKAVVGYKTFAGAGGGQADEWPAEKSLLILDISLDQAKKIGQKFGQDAIVFGFINQPAELVVLNLS